MPNTEQPTRNTLAIVLERIEQLKVDVNNLSGKFDLMSDNMQKFQLVYTAEHIKIVEQAAQAHKRLDVHDTRIQEIEQIVKSLQMCSSDMTNQVKQMKAILAGVVLMVAPLIITLIWEIITHQIVLVSP